MFAQRLVVVLGAGASRELHFPLGQALVSSIHALAAPIEPGKDGGRPLFRQLLSARAKQLNVAQPAMFEAGDLLHRAVRGRTSIDDALNYIGGRSPLAVEAGKIAIAQILTSVERQVAQPENWRAALGLGRTSQRTYLLELLTMALEGTRLGQDDSLFSNLTVINFNYDRSLEHYLHIGLRELGTLSESEAVNELASLHVIRPYGSLGQLPWQTSRGLRFGGEPNVTEILTAALNIRTFTEGIGNENLRDQIHVAMEQAHVVVILGFGFHVQNRELLQASEHLRSARSRNEAFPPYVYATSLGLHSDSSEYLRKRIAADWGISPARTKFYPSAASSLLSELRPVILGRLSQ